jgi:hypothetical protein
MDGYDIFRRELTIKGCFAQQFSFERALGAAHPDGSPRKG